MTRFIAGFPCTRKTTFGDWLRDHRGYLHVDMEGAKFKQSCLYAVWEKCAAARDVTTFVRQVEFLHPRIVITWGFPRQCSWAPASFRAAGARLSWFDAHPEAARAAWLQREGSSHADLDRQLVTLRAHREDFVQAFTGAIVPVLSEDGCYLDFLEIADIIGVPSPEE